jgi:uncharacterized protein YodC (DUF2158 family)
MTESSSQPRDFKPGDIVQLKSGGPAMTVVAVGGEGVHCLWYAELSDEVKTSTLPAISLESITILDDEDNDDDEDDDDSRGKKRDGKKKRHGDG